MVSPPIEIVVPVYNAPRDLAACVDSVLAHTGGAYRLVLIDDASPDAAIRAYFDELAGRAIPGLELIRNDRNLGFIGTANRGLARSRADVVLLNSDTIVTAGWLHALLRCAASDPRIGTITPFSNNAEICSLPRFCEDNPWPAGADPGPLSQAIASAAVPYYPDLPTGVGFCMFVRRALIDAIGSFDPAFGAGYGEENDFCLRADRAGFRNVLCDDAFVLHTGGRSFEGAKASLGTRNLALLQARHPAYGQRVADYIARDPLKPLREAAMTAYDRRPGSPLGVLHVIHGGGGTELHARSLVEATRGCIRHALATVRDGRWRIEEHRADGSSHTCEFVRRGDEPFEAFLRMLCASFGIGLVHLHNISGSREDLQDAMPRLDIPYGYTVHDLAFACPTITLQRADGGHCGGVTDLATCRTCLAGQGEHASQDIARWRERHGALLAGAAFVLAPSRWAADMLRRYFPGIDATVVPHGLPPRRPRRAGALQVVLLPDDGVPTVAILGAIGPDKGARRIERLAALAAAQEARVRFVVVGYLDRHHEAWQSDDGHLTVHGPYQADDLPALLDYYRASLVLFPSAGPESFAFTLSEAWAAGRAVLVPPIGALVERVGDHGAGFVMNDDEWRDERLMLDCILDRVSPDHAVALENAAARAARMPIPALDDMARATTAIYERAASRVELTHGVVDRRRICEANGYRPWSPPREASAEVTALPVPESIAAGSVQAPVRGRMRRLLGRLVPARAARASGAKR